MMTAKQANVIATEERRKRLAESPLSRAMTRIDDLAKKGYFQVILVLGRHYSESEKPKLIEDLITLGYKVSSREIKALDSSTKSGLYVEW